MTEIREEAEFVLFKKILNADQEAQFVPIGQCSLSDQKAFTLIIVPKNPDGAVYMIPVPIQKRPDGRSEIVLLNATNFLMAARINDDSALLPHRSCSQRLRRFCRERISPSGNFRG
jgi:hypothetical protein